MRILLLTYYYPPDAEVGGFRPAKVAAAFQARGHDVVVIAAARRAQVSGNVHRVVPLRNPRELYLALRRNGRNDSSSGIAAAPAGSNGVSHADGLPVAAPWKRFIFSLLWLPDECQGFIPRAVAEARRLHAQRPFDLVYTSAPPFSTHLAGMLFNRLSGVPWVAEFRDPWIGGAGKPARVRSGFSESVEAWLHARCMRAARQVVAVTDFAARSLSQHRSRQQQTPALLARNGIDHFDAPQPPRTGPVRIVYPGNLYLSRDPRPLLSALSELRRSGRLPAAGVAVEFIGDCRHFGNQSVEHLVHELGLHDLVTFRGQVPHAEVAAHMRHADILLLLAQQQPLQVPNKLYEYLGMQKPILAFVDRDGETATMLRVAGAHALVHEDDDAERTAAMVHHVLHSCRERMVVRQDVIRAWSTEQQLSRLVDEIEQDVNTHLKTAMAAAGQP